MGLRAISLVADRGLKWGWAIYTSYYSRLEKHRVGGLIKRLCPNVQAG